MPRRSLISRRPTSLRAVAEVGVLVAMLIWAANFTVVKAAVTAWPVLPFSAIRITAAGASACPPAISPSPVSSA